MGTNKTPEERKHFIESIRSDVERRLRQGENYEHVMNVLDLSYHEWFRLSSTIYNDYLTTVASAETKQASERIASINIKLADLAFAVPRLSNVKEVDELETELLRPNPDVNKISKLIVTTVMHPNMRALYHLSCYSIEKIHTRPNPIYPFRHIIESALLAFYRGNYVASYMTIIPVIEGILLRWQGYPQSGKAKPSFKDSIKYIANIHTRQPMPALPKFFDTWRYTAIVILKDHLFKSTNTGRSGFDFSRHLVAHLLYDTTFATIPNITRAFILIDVLFDLFLSEIQIPNFYFHASYGWYNSRETKTYLIYSSTCNDFLNRIRVHENYLRSLDGIEDLRNFV